MRDIIAVTSGKGGQGKSTLALGIGAAFQKLGKRVLIIDLDAGLRSVDLLANVSEGLVFDLGDILSGRDADDVIIPIPNVSGLHIIPAPNSYCEIDGQKLCALITSLTDYDKIILDFPAGTDFPYCREIAKIADFAVITGADALGMRDGYNMAAALKNYGADDIRIIINKYNIGAVKSGVFGGIDDIIDTTGCRLLGIVPFDQKLLTPTPGGIFANRLLGPSLTRIAKRIEGYNIPLPDIKKIQKGK